MDENLVRDVGGGRALVASVSPEGGWWIVLREGELFRQIRLTPWTLARVSRGKTYSSGGIEIRGLRHEAEFRIEGRFFGRIRHDALVELIAEAELTRPPRLP